MIETMRSIKKKFTDQRCLAKRRGIDFLLTFEEWYKIWVDSGHWQDRGTRKGQYVMSRKGDIGPYSVDNVVINTNADNIKEAWQGKVRGPQTLEHKEKVNASKIGRKLSQETIEKRTIAYKRTVQARKNNSVVTHN